MQSIAIAAPCLPGKVDTDRRAMQSILEAAFAGLASSQEPFDRWFRDVVRECHGIDLAQGFPPPELLIDHRRG